MTERRSGAGCTGERGLTLCADAELRIAGIDQGVGRGVVVRQDRDVQAGVLEVALLECYVQTGVVRVRCPVECEPNGPVGRAGVRGASGQNCERGCDRGRRGKRAAQRPQTTSRRRPRLLVECGIPEHQLIAAGDAECFTHRLTLCLGGSFGRSIDQYAGLRHRLVEFGVRRRS